MINPDEILNLMHGVNRSILRHGDAVLLRAGCPIEYLQFSLLKTIDGLDPIEEYSVYEISKRLRVDRSTLSHNSIKLAKQGFLVKRPCSMHKGKTSIMLSKLGKEVLNKYLDVYRQINEKATKDITEKFSDDLKRIERNLL